MIWIIGVGNIGLEYAKVLAALGKEFIAIGRGEASASAFENQTGHTAIRGGLTQFLATQPTLPTSVIVAVGVDVLSATTQDLLAYGVKKILLEKPGVGLVGEIDTLVAKSKGADVLLAYNRRFYSSTIKAEEIIEADGGVSSFSFEFTEWAHTFDVKSMNPITLSTWLLANSSHVIDTAFFLGGQPVEFSAFHSGEGELTWHPSGSKYAGAGVAKNGALFSYQGNWTAPGRWVVEILTKKHRLYFKPMETLQIQNIGSVTVNPVEIDNKLDVDFKPGFYLQTKAFLSGDYSRFCSIEQQREHFYNYYLKMSGYAK